MPRCLPLAPLLAAIPLTLALAQGPAPGGPPTPPPAPRTTAFSAQRGTWAWIRRDHDRTTLFVGGADRAPVEIARGDDWSDLALDGPRCWLLSRAEGTLSRVDLTAGATPQVVERNLHHPGGMQVQDDTLYWLEATGPKSVLGSFVAAAGPTLQLRSRSAEGVLRALSIGPCGMGRMCLPAPGDLTAITSQQAVVVLRWPHSTEIARVTLPQGEVRRIAAEIGGQQALMLGDDLYWTAPSEEAPRESGIRQVRRLRAGEGMARTVTEWLPESGELVALAGVPHYASLQLYRVPDRLGPAAIVGQLPAGAAPTTADGSRLIRLDGPVPAVAWRGKG